MHRVGVAVALLLSAAAPPTVAQQSTSFRITDQVVDSGGTPVQGSHPAGGLTYTCTNVACTAVTGGTMNIPNVNVGAYVARDTRRDGLGLILWFDMTNGDLRSGTGTLVDSGGTNVVGEYVSVAYGGDTVALVAYRDATAGTLKVKRCGNEDCRASFPGFAPSVVDPGPNTGAWTNIAIGTDGLPILVYGTPPDSAGEIKVVHCSNHLCWPHYRAR